MDSSSPSQKAKKQANKQMLMRLLIVVPLMFAFGYALVPLYKTLCDVTGINSLTNKFDYTPPENTQIDRSRTITVEFDANPRNTLRFTPMQRSIQVHPGELAQIMYQVTNTEAKAITAQAIPSYAPIQAGRYFNKLDCFCFTQQKLQPNEIKQMPVVFIIDPDLPKDVQTITLSYTFFKVS
jgi:cytochrome c oxidase assembly protein subunit 11